MVKFLEKIPNNSNYSKIATFQFLTLESYCKSRCDIDIKSLGFYKESKKIDCTINLEVMGTGDNIKVYLDYSILDCVNFSNNNDFLLPDDLLNFVAKTNEKTIFLDLYIKNNDTVKLSYNIYNMDANGYVICIPSKAISNQTASLPVSDLAITKIITNKLDNIVTKTLQNTGTLYDNTGANSNLYLINNRLEKSYTFYGEIVVKSNFKLSNAINYLTGGIITSGTFYNVALTFSDGSYGIGILKFGSNAYSLVSILTEGKTEGDVAKINLTGIKWYYN